MSEIAGTGFDSDLDLFKMFPHQVSGPSVAAEENPDRGCSPSLTQKLASFTRRALDSALVHRREDTVAVRAPEPAPKSGPLHEFNPEVGALFAELINSSHEEYREAFLARQK
jgi:hypothetical protein